MESLLDEKAPDSIEVLIAEGSSQNSICVDCNSPDIPVEWCSMAFGVLVCLACAGDHRSLGSHISSIRSTKLDTWSESQINVIKYGGNARFKDYIASCSNSTDISIATIATKYSDINPAAPIATKYKDPRILYYREILLARLENRQQVPMDIVYYDNLSKKYSSNKSPGKVSSSPKDWTPDKEASSCMICVQNFTLFNRRHHCRRCGKCICDNCGPATNTRPIPEWGWKEPVRHCKLCYQSPNIDWTRSSQLGLK